MTDNNNEAHKQASRIQQETLDNMQRILSKILTNRNNEKISGNHNREEENFNEETPENEHSKESFQSMLK